MGEVSCLKQGFEQRLRVTRLAFKRQVTSSISERCRWQRGTAIRRQGLAWKESSESKQEALKPCWPAMQTEVLWMVYVIKCHHQPAEETGSHWQRRRDCP